MQSGGHYHYAIIHLQLHREVHKPVKQLNDVGHEHNIIAVERTELVAAQHSSMLVWVQQVTVHVQ